MDLNLYPAALIPIAIVILCFYVSAAPDVATQGFGFALKEGSALIENEGLQITFAKSNGHIRALIDKEAGMDLWRNGADEPLFRLVLTQPAKARTRLVSSDDFKDIRFSSRREGRAETLRIVFSQCRKAELRATCTFTVEKGSKLISARMGVENDSLWAIKNALYPSIALTKQIGESGEDDRLLLPGSGGVLFKNPGSLNMMPGANYPGWASFQMQAYYDNDAGLYLATYDATGEVKLFMANGQSESMDMTPVHIRPEVIGGDFEDAYPVVLAPIRAPWYNAADLYKAWAKDQFWCKKTLVQREDLPEWLKTGPAMVMTTTALEQVGAMNYQDDLDGYLDSLEHYRRTAGTKHLILANMGWEKQGSWVGIDYFPSKPSDAWWKALSEKGKERGIHTTFMTNGYKWTIKRHAYDFGDAFESGEVVDNTEEWQKNLNVLITQADGKPMVNGRDYKPGSWIGAFSKICRGSREGRQIITGVFEHLAKEMGASSGSFDQEVGGGEDYPCYHPDHGHPPGKGRWMWEGYRDNLTDILTIARDHVKDFFLYQENEGEYTIPFQGTSWARNYHIYGHPNPYAWGIPVYPYLYHEYITSIGGALHFGMGQGINVGRGHHPIAAETRAYATARNLAFGQLQGDRTAAVLLNKKGIPEGIVSRAYFSFCKPLSDHSEFLVLGRMKRPFPLSCRNTDIHLYTSPHRAVENRFASNLMIAALPAVLQGVYESSDGKVGVILVNATDRVQEAEITLAENGATGTKAVHEYRKGERVATHRSEKDTLLKIHFDRLEPVFLLLE